jgi:hypothetical protein
VAVTTTFLPDPAPFGGPVSNHNHRSIKMRDTPRPQYAHDCAGCRFLGTYLYEDLYICTDTYIARRSQNKRDYVSFSQVLVDKLPRNELPHWVQVATDMYYNLGE